MDEAIVMPFRKVYCGSARPMMPASAIRQTSLKGTFSGLVKSDIIQKMAAARIILDPNSASGDTVSAFAISLQNTMFSPNIVYAAAHARCPVSLEFMRQR